MKLNEIKCLDQISFLTTGDVVTTSTLTKIIYHVDLKVNENVTMSAKTFNSIKPILFDNGTLEVKGNTVIIKNDKSKIKISNTETLVESLDRQSPIYKVNLPTNALSTACNFVSTREDHLFMNGVMITNTGVIYATDSFKAYRYKEENSEAESDTFSVPTEFIKSLPKVESLELGFTKTAVMYEDQEYYIVSSLYSGTAPKMDNIFDQARTHWLVFDKPTVSNLLGLYYVTLKLEQTRAQLTYNDLEANSQEVELKIGSNIVEAFEIDFQAEFFNTCLLHETITLGYTSQLAAVRITFGNSETVILSPVRKGND